MTDSQILNEMLEVLKLAVTKQRPLSPAMIAEMIGETEAYRTEERRAIKKGAIDVMAGSPLNAELYVKLFPIGAGTVTNGVDKPIELFWKCAHMPSAIDNYFSRDLCVHGCHRNELRWHDNGCSQAI